MTRFPRCSHACCFATGQCCGCCGKSQITDPAVRALMSALHATYRRMEALEGRCAAAIATLQEARHGHELSEGSDNSTPNLDFNLAAGTDVLGVSAAPFNPPIASMIETLRTQRT